ncbi:HAD-IC family P-type ATPase [Erwinia sp. CGal63]|uniref:HAD-IC family P-type ATPase n=1 Tax=Erwinia sp. CGal63 TaxID=2919889 RepID=UPI00300B7686
MTQKLKPAPAWSRYDAAGVIRRMHSHESGLSAEEAQKRLVGIGPNKLPTGDSPHPAIRLLAHCTDALTCILLVAAFLTAVTGRWLDTGAILAAIALNVLVGWLQQSDEEKALKSLEKMLPDRALVKRDGNVLQINASELVPGDIVMLKTGDKVPADLRLIDALNLRVDETALTGETAIVSRQATIAQGEEPASRRETMLFSGSIIVSGSATGVVIATGEKTELGKIQQTLTAIKPRQIPLLRQLERFGNGFLLLVITLIAFLFIFSLLRHGLPIAELTPKLAGLALSAVPEGLPAIIALTLMLGARTMARKKIVVRRLPGAETLGAMTVICSDKTGVLTTNEMTVKALILHNETIRVEGNGHRPEGRFLQEKVYQVVEPAAHPLLSRLLQNMDLCNDSELLKNEQGEWRVVGEPISGALKVAAAKARLPEAETQLLEKLPFDPARKYQATHHQINGIGYLLATGDPEALLRLCDFQQTEQGLAPLDSGYWQQQIAQYAGEGLHLVASACRLANKDQAALGHEELQNGLIFCGMAAIMDPPRPEAAEAIALCHRAGIRVKMMADDRPETALSIGRMLGIGDSRNVLSGARLERMTDAELAQAASRYDIFVDLEPQHKLGLIAALQSEGEVVGITGNGVYHAPALKQADVGIATGANSAAIAQEVADLTATDSSFATIASAIQEGRRVRDRLKKAVRFVLPVCLAQTLLFIVAMLAGKMMPLTPLQILWINITASIALALSLAFEKGDSSGSREAESRLFWRIGFVGVLIMLSAFVMEIWLQSRGYEPAFIRTMLLQTLVTAQCAYLLNCREPERFSLNSNLLKSRGVWLAGCLMALLQLALITWPAMNALFDTVPLPLDFWLITLAVGALLFAAFELTKSLMHRWVKG